MNVNVENTISEKLREIYGEENLNKNLQRYAKLREKFVSFFGDREITFFSSPGRTELSGNHTDHNKGLALAASVQLDSVAAVCPNNKSEIIIYSDVCGNDPFVINLNNLDVHNEELGKLSGIVRGIARYFIDNNFNISGFNASITSNIPFGSGLSSSASIEVLIGEIFNHFFNNNKISKFQIAIAGQFAENNYFGKPCGLLDQITCAYGGTIKIDFEASPKIEQIAFDLDSKDFALLVVNTGESHSDLTSDYAEIIEEMKLVAKYFGEKYLRHVPYDSFYASINELRENVSERAILRAMHFFEENRRVKKQADALARNNFEQFLTLVSESGKSSAMLLQNLFLTRRPKEQPITLAIAMTEKFIDNEGETVRIHGGGFAGTIQVYLRKEKVSSYKEYMEKVFGAHSVLQLKLRNIGVTVV